MRAGEELPDKESDRFENTPFSRIEAIKLTSDEFLDVILSEAEKIRSTCEKRGTIRTDSAVVDALGVPRETVDRSVFYAYKVGPVAATCEDLNWKAAYSMDIETAPEPNSDAFREAASELQVPNNAAMKLGPKFIQSAYRILYEHTAETGRPIHPTKLKYEANVRLAERGYKQAFRFLNQLPGVEGPADSVAWEYEQPEQVNAKEEIHA